MSNCPIVTEAFVGLGTRCSPCMSCSHIIIYLMSNTHTRNSCPELCPFSRGTTWIFCHALHEFEISHFLMKDETERWNGNRASMSDSEHIISGNSKSTRLGPFHLQITHALLAELLKVWVLVSSPCNGQSTSYQQTYTE